MFKNICRGIAIGITETVPGVSSSTIAMILGIYERLIYSLSILTTNKRREGLPFLFTLGMGMVLGLGMALFVIDYLLNTYHTQTFMFFVGIIVGFLPFLWKEALNHSNHNIQVKHYMIMIIFLILVAASQLLENIHQLDMAHLSVVDFLFFAVAGFIASTALILPGISGALILIILGIYEIAVTALTTFYIPVIMTLGFGVIIGILFISKLVRYLLIHYTVATYAAMIGLVAGSIFAIFNNLEGPVDMTVILTSGITFFAGIVFVYVLKQTQRSKSI